jgi:hypothetical protein
MNSFLPLTKELESRAYLFAIFLLLIALPIMQAAPLNAGTVPEDWYEPVVDSTYTLLVRQYTSEERYISPLIEHLPDHPSIPSPREFLGYIVGAPNKLTYYKDIKAYMEQLDAASPRVRLFPMGYSNEGREMIVLIVSSESTLDELPRYVELTARLSDPRITSGEVAQNIIRRAKPFYYLTGGLHSTETGSPEMLAELAYRLAVGDSPLIRRIRDNVITMITPVLEVDGRERMVDWYYQVTIDHEDWEDMPPKSPPYWGKYIFHDSNRDGIQLSQPLSKNLARIFFQYHPQVMHDLHESIPLLYVSSGTGPYNEALDPIVTSEWQLLSNYEVAELTKFGLPGVWTWGFYTGWYPGYLMWFANNHNSIGRFYETFGNAGASTFERKLEQSFAKKKVTAKQWYRPIPPDKKIKWTFRNNINYMETGVLVALDFAAQNGSSLLFNYWKKGQNAIQEGRTEPPHAWIIIRDNQNKFELAYLVNNLLLQGIEVHALDAAAAIGDQNYPAGSFVVRMDQPYGTFARSLFEHQSFPKDASYRPYDDVAWTLPLLYGIEAFEIRDPSIFNVVMSPLKDPVHLPGEYEPMQSNCYIVPVSASQKYLEARFLLQEFEVFAADTGFSVDKKFYPMGSWIIPAEAEQEKLDSILVLIADSLSIDIYSSRSVPDVPKHPLDIPRIALFHSWTYTQDSGWVRYTLDTAGIPYALIDKDDLRMGELRELYDVILFPNLGWFFKPKHLIHGIDSKWGPLPYAKTDRFPNLGRIDHSLDITGGMGFEGLSNLERFIDDGGTLITFAAGSLIPAELGLVRHIDHISPDDFFNPGSVIRAMVTDSSNPIICGYDSLTMVFRGTGPLFTVSKKYRHFTVLQYGTKIPDEDDSDDADAAIEYSDSEKHKASPMQEKHSSICISGLIKGEKHLNGRPAILDVPKGRGRVIMFTFNPLHRFMTHANFGLAYNAILHWNDRGSGKESSRGN